MKRILLVLSLVSVFVASYATAAQAPIWTRVSSVLVADQGRWGGCMARLTESLAEFGLNCPSTWVSFSCTGDFTTKDNAFRMFEAAQVAFALETRAYVVVDDTRKHNGICYANRIDLAR